MPSPDLAEAWCNGLSNVPFGVNVNAEPLSGSLVPLTVLLLSMRDDDGNVGRTACQGRRPSGDVPDCSDRDDDIGETCANSLIDARQSVSLLLRCYAILNRGRLLILSGFCQDRAGVRRVCWSRILGVL
ncbi:MAG: hypothetical protein HZA66_26085 [Rhodopseudomonas palustris]|uniref:Uncharacterized protein n=1 Tax=Rhodopseudomonas palustris TaxID=1076 RepID=A0A933S375_RHOPL|nr:hypothetical protein [Rhodopseudomonas palustris]